MPENTTIFGAFKITGKTKKGISIGIIDGITAKESAQLSYLGRRFVTQQDGTAGSLSIQIAGKNFDTLRGPFSSMKIGVIPELMDLILVPHTVRLRLFPYRFHPLMNLG
jgi:hypothetical protein